MTLGAAAAGLTNVVSSVRTSRRISERADGQLEDAQNEVKDREAALEEARNLKDALEIDKYSYSCISYYLTSRLILLQEVC